MHSIVFLPTFIKIGEIDDFRSKRVEPRWLRFICDVLPGHGYHTLPVTLGRLMVTLVWC